MFHYHPHLASGIFYAFSGIGGLTFPLLYGALIEEYTVHGLLLIVGGLYLNLAAVALFLEPKTLRREQLGPVVQRAVKVSTINGEGQTENEIVLIINLLAYQGTRTIQIQKKCILAILIKDSKKKIKK